MFGIKKYSIISNIPYIIIYVPIIIAIVKAPTVGCISIINENITPIIPEIKGYIQKSIFNFLRSIEVDICSVLLNNIHKDKIKDIEVATNELLFTNTIPIAKFNKPYPRYLVFFLIKYSIKKDDPIKIKIIPKYNAININVSNGFNHTYTPAILSKAPIIKL